MKDERNVKETAIAYQNKDIASKVLAENFKNKSFSVYGIDIPKIVDVKPTELPAIEANELRLDDLFYLEDKSVAIVDYESRYSEESKIKYIGYLARVIKKIYNDEKRFRIIRLIIIYTADVERGTTISKVDMGCTGLELTEAFLSDIDSEEVRNRLSCKLENGISLDDEDLMKLVIYPLTFKGKRAKQKAISDAIDMAEMIQERDVERFVLSIMLTFADKVISRKDSDRIVRRIKMRSKVLQYFEDEKNEAVESAVEKMAEGLLREEIPIDKIIRVTGLTKKQINAIERQMLQNA